MDSNPRWSMQDETAMMRLVQQARRHQMMAHDATTKLRGLAAIKRDMLLKQQRTSKMPKLFRIKGVYNMAGYTCQLTHVTQNALVFRCDVYDDRLFSPNAEFEYRNCMFRVAKRNEFRAPGRAGSVVISFEIFVRPVVGRSCNYIGAA